MAQTPNHNRETLCRFALTLADAATAQIMPYFRSAGEIANKDAGGFDPVTEGDKAGERAMRQLIEEAYPEHGIFGEEYGVKPSTSGYEWILDPIDGTRSFIAGLPTWMTLIGLRYEGRVIAGVARQGFTAESFVGDGERAWYAHGGRTQPLKVKPAASLSAARAGTTGAHQYRTARHKRLLDGLKSTCLSVRYDADAYFFCMVAAGQMDLALDMGLAAYDIAALIPVIEGAGGVVRTIDGGTAANGGDIVAAASETLYAEAIALATGS